MAWVVFVEEKGPPEVVVSWRQPSGETMSRRQVVSLGYWSVRMVSVASRSHAPQPCTVGPALVVGTDDGADDGTGDGEDAGAGEGAEVGTGDGADDGMGDGAGVDEGKGTAEGAANSANVGCDGKYVGADDGADDGAADGADNCIGDGVDDGTAEGAAEGVEDGDDVGTDDGANDGAGDGEDVGTDDGVDDGAPDGADNGICDGVAQCIGARRSSSNEKELGCATEASRRNASDACTKRRRGAAWSLRINEIKNLGLVPKTVRICSCPSAFRIREPTFSTRYGAREKTRSPHDLLDSVDESWLLTDIKNRAIEHRSGAQWGARCRSGAQWGARWKTWWPCER